MNSVTRRNMTHRIDEIDGQIEKIRRLIENSSRLDPEMGAGLGVSEDMTLIQKKIDKGAVEVEGLCRALRTVEHEIPDIL